MALVPMVVSRSANGERVQDIFSCLLENRIIMLGTDFNDSMAGIICAELLYLDSLNVKGESPKPIQMYINSPGGSVTSALAIYDTMQLIKSPVHTTAMGLAASAGSLILTAGDERRILPNARVMCHQPSSYGGGRNTVTDAEIAHMESKELKRRLTEIYVKHNSKGKTFEQIIDAFERDKWFSGEEAVEFGLVDKVLYPEDN